MTPYSFLQFLVGSAVKKHTELVSGLENIPKNEPCIFAPNHIDFLDGLYFILEISRITKRKIYFIARHHSPYWLVGGNTMVIDYKDKGAVLKKAFKKMKNNVDIAIFPEGERNSEKKLLSGKTGVARLAMITGRPIVPIGLEGPSGKAFLHSVKLLLCNKGKVKVKIGQPLRLDRLEEESLDPDRIQQVTQKVMQEIAQLSNKEYSKK